MPLIALASVKASPGVTTTALALAAVWPARRRLLIEADPSGGDLCAWLGLPLAPGLSGLAADVRHDQSRGVVWRHARQLAGGVHAVAAPAGAEQAAACLATVAGTRIFTQFAAEPAVAVADCGRLDPGSPALAVAAQADITLLLVRPRVSELSHLAPRVAALTQAGLHLGLLLAPDTGRAPAEAAYAAGEIAVTLVVPVYARFPDDPGGAAHLVRQLGQFRGCKRLPLARSAASLAACLATAPGPPASGAMPASHPDALQRPHARQRGVSAGG